MQEGARELCVASFKRVLIPFMMGSILMIKHFSKALPLNTIILGIRISSYEFLGDTNIPEHTEFFKD